MRLPGLESTTKTTLEMVVIHGLAEVTNDSVLQSTPPDDLVRVCGNEDRRNRVPCSDEMSVELKTSHSRHLNVGDQAHCCCEERGRQEVGCRRERLGSVAQRGYEFSHGFSKRLIVLHDRYQVIFRHRGFQATFAAFQCVALACHCVMSAKVRDKAMPAPLSDGLWLRLSA